MSVHSGDAEADPDSGDPGASRSEAIRDASDALIDEWLSLHKSAGSALSPPQERFCVGFLLLVQAGAHSAERIAHKQRDWACRLAACREAPSMRASARLAAAMRPALVGASDRARHPPVRPRARARARRHRSGHRLQS